MLRVFAGQRGDRVAARLQNLHGDAADAAGRAGDDDRTGRRRQAVAFELDEGERRGEAGGAWITSWTSKRESPFGTGTTQSAGTRTYAA